MIGCRRFFALFGLILVNFKWSRQKEMGLYDLIDGILILEVFLGGVFITNSDFMRHKLLNLQRIESCVF